MTLKIRAVNYTSTDEDGNKIYTSHAFQTQRDDGVWVCIPVIEIYVEPDEPLPKPKPGQFSVPQSRPE
jgi:hypothetical protein